jgi:hypothetical protein
MANWMDWTCNMNEREVQAMLWHEDIKEWDLLEDTGIAG